MDTTEGMSSSNPDGREGNDRDEQQRPQRFSPESDSAALEQPHASEEEATSSEKTPLIEDQPTAQQPVAQSQPPSSTSVPPRATAGPASEAGADVKKRRTSAPISKKRLTQAPAPTPSLTPSKQERSDSADVNTVADVPTQAIPSAAPVLQAEAPANWPITARPVRPLTPTQLQALSRAERLSRRRRRFATFVKRNERAHTAARNRILVRASIATVVVTILLIVSVVTATFGASASYYDSETVLIKGLNRAIAAQDSVRIFDRHGTLLYQFTDNGAQHSITLAQIPVSVVNATISIEDHTFWTNDGVDVNSIARAAIADYTSQHISQGASTITQQLIKQQLLHDSNVSFSRKLQEAVLAIGVTKTGAYSKSQILEMYLNSIPYSPTAYGIDAAATYYFGYKDDPATGRTAAQQLDLAQASMLAGIPQNPNLNDPLQHPEHARDRQKEVLANMVQYGYITQAQANAAYAETGKPNFYHTTTYGQNLAPHFVDYVKGILQQMVQTGQIQGISRSGLNVYTTLDLSLQNHTLQAMRQHIYGNDQTDFASPTYVRNDNVTNSAGLIVNQHNGDILVMQGSVDYNRPGDGQHNVITQGYRSPGSSFKPFVYATAFEKGWFPAMTVADVPTPFYQGDGLPPYKPLDFSADESAGTVTLRTALDWSLNIPAVKVMQFAGIDDVRRQVARMGITDPQGTWGLTSVLGALDIPPIEMVQAYTVFANYGQFIPLHAIDHITDSLGGTIYQYHQPQPVQVMDPRIAFLITSMLSDNASRSGDFGGCSPLYLDPYLGHGQYHYTFSGVDASGQCGSLYSSRFLSPQAWPTAAKTGTAQDFTDDWTMGYTMDYTGGVWVGNSDSTSMYNIDGVSGAAPIWYSSMLYAEESTGKAHTAFPVPKGVHLANYCAASGVCSTDWFLNGQNPPPNMGEKADGIPCVALDPKGGWNYSSTCEVSLKKDGVLQNAGAPTNSTKYVGAP